MSNTVIQIKRSISTAVPPSLGAAEPAYSYVSNKLFLGDSSGTGVIAIGGQFYVDQQNTIFDIANAAFEKANTGDPVGSAAFDTANAGFGLANSNYAAVVAAYGQANIGTTTAVASFDFANLVSDIAIAGNVTGNAAFDKANSANVFAYNNSLAITSNYDATNAAYTEANTASARGVAAYDQANTGTSIAVAAFNDSNTRLSTSGGTVTGDVSIIGTLNLSGNTVFANVETLRITDPLLYLAGNNYVSDIVDIGFIANYNDGSANLHTGIFRDAGTKEYYVFQGYNEEPENNHIDPTANGFTLAVLNADLKTSNLTLGGQNTIVWINSAYDQANVGTTAAGAGFDAANASYGEANTSTTRGIAAFGAANAAYDQANTATLLGGIVFNAANAGFTAANTAQAVASAGYDQANTGTSIAVAAFGAANTADTNAANASYLSTGTVPSSRISGSYSGITGVGTITAGTWNASTIDVNHGGTGKTNFTLNGVLYGNTLSPISVTSAGTEGQVLQASATGVPLFAMLDGGSF